ncbi:MAG: hypothetical protein KAJ07_02460 [Planctomycetes bacterium]|nr:hypothetical protein [Planctomycetota bacterium]
MSKRSSSISRILVLIGVFAILYAALPKDEDGSLKSSRKTSVVKTKENFNQEKQSYLDKVAVLNLRAEKRVLYEWGIRGEIKNTGNRTLSKVEVTIYFLDENAKRIYEQTYYPVRTSGLFSDNQPLKPNYGEKFFYAADDIPSNWSQMMQASVTDIEFASEDLSGSKPKISSAKKEALVFKEGEIVEFGDFSYEVDGSLWGRILQPKGKPVIKPKQAYLVVAIFVSNNDVKARTVPKISLVDQFGQEHMPSSVGGAIDELRINYSESLSPNVRKEVAEIFDVSVENSYRLKVSDGNSPEKTAFIKLLPMRASNIKKLKTMTETKINKYVSKEIMRDTYKLECLSFDKDSISYIIKFNFPIHYNGISPRIIGKTAVQAIIDSVMDHGWKPQKEILGVYVRIYANSNEKSPTGKRLEYHYGKSVYDPVDDRIIWQMK